MQGKSTRFRVLALALTILVFIGIIFLTRRSQQVRQPNDMPQSVIWSVIDASRNGNVKAYLDCFTGDLERNLRKTAEAMGESQFVDYLKQTNREIKGIAVSELTRISDDELSLKVEFVHKDKNEVQEHYLKKVGIAWKILDVKGTARVKTLVPYGAEVTPLIEKK